MDASARAAPQPLLHGLVRGGGWTALALLLALALVLYFATCSWGGCSEAVSGVWLVLLYGAALAILVGAARSWRRVAARAGPRASLGFGLGAFPALVALTLFLLTLVADLLMLLR